MKVAFTIHALDRLNSRLGIKVKKDTEVDIADTFKLARTYIHKDDGSVCENWACTIPGARVVMIVCKDSRVVRTVVTDGPIVDDAYKSILQ